MTKPVAPPAPHPLDHAPAPRLGSRALFPRLGARAYLAHAAISPASSATDDMVSAYLRSVAELGVGSFPAWAAQRERLRESVARLLGVDPEHLALTPGCTKGMTDVALALPWRPGDVLLTYRGEFPANVTPWQLAAAAHDARVDFLELPDPRLEDCADRIIDDLTRRLAAEDAPRFLAVSAVQFQTGLRMPIERMAAATKESGCRLLVDGIQAAGAMPLEVMTAHADAFFVGSHKWMLGLEGVGLAYIAPHLMAELRPLTAGWRSFPEAEQFLFAGPGHLRYDRSLLETPKVFEGSTVAAVGFAALEAGVAIVEQLGPSAIFDHVQSYHDAIEPALEQIGFRSLRSRDPNLRSTSLALRAPEGVDVIALAAHLKEAGIVISIPDGTVRLAPHFSNGLDEVGAVTSAFVDSVRHLKAR